MLVIILGMSQTLPLGIAIHTGFFSSNIYMSLNIGLFFYLIYKQFYLLHEDLQQATRIILFFSLVFIPLSIVLNISGYELSNTYPIALSPLAYVLIMLLSF